MIQRTLSSLARDAEALVALEAEARRRGLEVGDLLAVGGHSMIFAVKHEERAVLKVPWAPPRSLHAEIIESDGRGRGRGPNRLTLEGTTGDYMATPLDALEHAAALLDLACRRQADRGVGRPLARLLGVERLAGLPCAVYENVGGFSLRRLIDYRQEEARAALRPLARALHALHAGFGAHSDLKPDHVHVLSADAVVLIDPLVMPNKRWLGSVGYALPLVVPSGGDGLGDVERLRDLVAFAAIAVEAYGGDLGFVRWHLLDTLIFQRLGRTLAKVGERALPLPDGLRGWVVSTVQTGLRTAAGEPLPEGTTATLLEDLQRALG
jgi:hypothetical protein